MKKFEAIILSGGKGTRVKKYTKKNPKCLIEINGKPFLYHQLKYLKKNNIKDVIVSVGYQGGKIKSYLKKNIDFINTKIVNDGKKPLGTGGAVKYVIANVNISSPFYGQRDPSYSRPGEGRKYQPHCRFCIWFQ